MKSLWENIAFAHPSTFWLMILLPLLIGWFIWRQADQYPEIHVSNWKGIVSGKKFWRSRLRPILFVFRILSIMLLITAMAQPEMDESQSKQETLGIDIVITLDVSPSMLAKDFSPNRIEAAKNIAGDFIAQRPNDRIGLVVFSGEAFTQCPITTDHLVLADFLSKIKAGNMQSGTAIGSGLGTAVNRLKESEAISKVIILLTDGVNNTGSTDPRTAADLAATFGIRVHTIGVGTRGLALSPVAVYPNGQYAYKRVPVEIDEDLLKDIAAKTGGEYFRAVNNESLKNIYSTIDHMEKSRIELSVLPKKKLFFLPLVLLGAGLLLFEIFLRETLFRTAM